ncbi:MAG: hypothetical protein PHP30_05120 [Bacteroidales bacterium]|nr:hypothetical protein [Bacteroidales bacterium]MDD2425116.1 hypothetical protein [Bacteroidales bacterium]MDD3989463.1 hypothetical protein [Bacteroidales bacterium]MDD4638491.1 hypothetical protein [Bacteroidales bacterium]
MKSRSEIFLIIAVFILLQALLSNFINFGPLFFIALYPLLILTFPAKIPLYERLLMSFLLGIGVDLTGGFILGLNAAAATFLSFVQPLLLKMAVPHAGLDKSSRPGLSELGLTRFLYFIIAGLMIHQAVVEILENFSMIFSFQSLLRYFLSIFVNTLIILLSEYGIFYKNRG